MDTQEIIEGEILISEFDGWIKHNGRYWHKERNITTYYDPVDFQYHSDWSRLMPVVEKIEAIHQVFSNGYINVRISQGYIQIEGAGKKIFKNTSIEGSKIKALWLAVIEFIQWYNQNKGL